MELTGRLLNPSGSIQRLLGLTPSSAVSLQLTEIATPTVRQRQVHLPPDAQEELVRRYVAGELQRDLAEAYGIERRTAMAIIRRHGAQRTLGLSCAQIEEAVGRYGAGESLAAIGKTLGVAADTVRRRLLERGVSMRSANGDSQEATAGFVD